MAVTPVVHLAPDRRRLAKSIYRAFFIAAASDQKKYASGKPFLPIFPTDNTALQAAIGVVVGHLADVLAT